MTSSFPPWSRRRWAGALALSLLAIGTIPAGTADAYEPYVRGTGARVAGLGDLGSGPAPEFATVMRGSTHDVAVVSASSGIELWHCEGEDGLVDFGESVDVPADVDGDGVLDVVVGAPGGGGPREAGFVRVLSGKAGATLRTYVGDPDRRFRRYLQASTCASSHSR